MLYFLPEKCLQLTSVKTNYSKYTTVYMGLDSNDKSLYMRIETRRAIL